MSEIGTRYWQLQILKATVAGTLGILTENYSVVTTVWASRKNMNQLRALQNGVDTLEGTTVWNFLYYDYPNIDKTCQVKSGTQTYTINSVEVTEDYQINLITKIML